MQESAGLIIQKGTSSFCAFFGIHREAGDENKEKEEHYPNTLVQSYRKIAVNTCAIKQGNEGGEVKSGHQDADCFVKPE
jgi:hypothetical protein